uniref:Uncharacterized protein n=1 Tax=Heterorhabditis bacteriophora TaxID=37862 RepID=A0A1I7WSL3_HETBA
MNSTTTYKKCFYRLNLDSVSMITDPSLFLFSNQESKLLIIFNIKKLLVRYIKVQYSIFDLISLKVNRTKQSNKNIYCNKILKIFLKQRSRKKFQKPDNEI